MALSHSLRGVFPCYLYRLIGHEQLYLKSLGAGSIKWSHRQLNLVKFGTRQVHFTPFCGPTCDRIVTVSKDFLKSVSRSIERCVFEWNSSKIDRLVAVASKRPDVTADETFSTNLHVRIGSDLHSPASVKAFLVDHRLIQLEKQVEAVDWRPQCSAEWTISADDTPQMAHHHSGPARLSACNIWTKKCEINGKMCARWEGGWPCADESEEQRQATKTCHQSATLSSYCQFNCRVSIAGSLPLRHDTITKRPVTGQTCTRNTGRPSAPEGVAFRPSAAAYPNRDVAGVCFIHLIGRWTVGLIYSDRVVFSRSLNRRCIRKFVSLKNESVSVH